MSATHHVTEDVLLKSLRWRYATKKFDTTQKIPANLWHTLEEILRLTPSSYGLQPWKFIVVENQELRAKIKAAAWNQSQMTDASHLLVFAMKKDVGEKEITEYLEHISKVRGVPIEALGGFRDMLIGNIVKGPIRERVNEWASRQVYIALGNLLTSAAALGIDTCPMEGFDPAQVDEILGLPAKGLHAVVIATLGYRAKDDSHASGAKVRFDKKDVIIHV